MTKTEHQQYTATEHWRNKRRWFINDCGHNICERCGMDRYTSSLVYDQDLHVHHKNYTSKWNEREEDLETLCKRCHEIETNGRTSLRELKPAFTCWKCSVQVFHEDYYSGYCEPVCIACWIEHELKTPVHRWHRNVRTVISHLHICPGDDECYSPKHGQEDPFYGED